MAKLGSQVELCIAEFRAASGNQFFHEKFEALEKSVATAIAALGSVPRDLDSESWARPPDRSISRLNAPDISIDSIYPSLGPWFSDAGVKKDDIEIDGPKHGKYFTLGFLATDLATRDRRAAKCKGLLKFPPKRWRGFRCEGNPLHIDCDKNPMRVRG